MRRSAWTVAAAGLVMASATFSAQQLVTCPSGGSLVKRDLLRLISGQVSVKRLEQYVGVCGVSIDLTPDAEEDLRAVGATDAMIAVVRKALQSPAGAIRPPATVEASSSAAQNVITDARGISWARIPRGSFEMGCTAGDVECDADEQPRHRVTLTRDVWLQTTEVTVGQYRAAGLGMPEQPVWNQGERLPIVTVTWDEAAAFCRAVGGRLPTEAEWEYAARGGRNDWRYPWGNAISPENANYAGTGGQDRWAQTSPVRAFAANGYDLSDMAGNVWEWVADWYGASHYGAASASDPRGPTSGQSRVVRGGSWLSGPEYLRVSIRNWSVPSDRDSYVGFRCARDGSP